MMRNKKLTAWAMALVLTVSLLAGCGAEPPATTAPAQTVQTLPPTTAATETTETVAPTEPEPVPTTEPQPTKPEPVPMELSRDERYEINIFLSNFSEQWFHEGWPWNSDGNTVFYSAEASVEEMVNFLWIFAKINRGSEMQYINRGENSYYAFTNDTIASLAQRFFGRTLTERDLQAMELEYFTYIDGMVCSPAADGETYMNMTVTDELYDLGDGTMRAEFVIYEAWDYADAGGHVQGKDLYRQTGQEARDNPHLEIHRKGAAIVRPQTLFNGRESYQLVSYQVFDPEA